MAGKEDRGDDAENGAARLAGTGIASAESRREARSLPHRRYPERVNFWNEGGVNGARRAAAPDATATSPT